MPEQLFNVWTTDISVPGCRWHVLPGYAALKEDAATHMELICNDVAIRREVPIRYLMLATNLRPGNGMNRVPLVMGLGPSEMKR